MNGDVVYGDVLFIINFSMDFLILFCTCKILHVKRKNRYLILAACLGGAYSVAALFITNALLSVLCSIAVAALLCFISTFRVKPLLYLKFTALFYGLSLLLGGAMTALYVLLNKLGREIPVNSGISPVMSDIPLGVFCVLGLLSVVLAYVTGRIFGKNSGKKEAKVEIRSVCGSVSLLCLSDSGALLCDPLSGDPVIIVNCERIRACVPEELSRSLYSDSLNDPAPGLRLIPGGSVCGDSLLRGFVPESVKVNGFEKRAVVAVVKNKNFGTFDGIVPSSLCE